MKLLLRHTEDLNEEMKKRTRYQGYDKIKFALY